MIDEPRIERQANRVRLSASLPDAQAPPEYPSPGRYWPSFITSQGACAAAPYRTGMKRARPIVAHYIYINATHLANLRITALRITSSAAPPRACGQAPATFR